MSGQILFLEENQMNVLQDGRCRKLTSEREQQYIETLRELEKKYEWKTTGAGAQFMGKHNPYAGAAQAHCRIPAICGRGDKLLYALITPDAGMLYEKEILDDSGSESYHYGEKSFDVTDLDALGNRIACAVNDTHGEYHIALLENGRAGYRWVTQGDTKDSAPWFSRREDKLYYASVGFARNENGILIAIGPSSVQCLSLAAGSLEEICADDETDYLRPKEGPDGALYMIVRPYKLPEKPRKSMADRVRGVGNFFRAMGMIVKMVSQTSEPQPEAHTNSDVQTRVLNGRVVDITVPRGGEEDKGCAPDDWVLMRRAADGSLTEVQRGVADYAFDGQRLIYTDGRRIFACEDGKKELLYKGTFIPRISVAEKK